MIERDMLYQRGGRSCEIQHFLEAIRAGRSRSMNMTNLAEQIWIDESVLEEDGGRSVECLSQEPDALLVGFLELGACHD